MMRYQHIQVGQRIRAFDHENRDGREPLFVEGTVVKHARRPTGLYPTTFLEITCEKDTTYPADDNRVGESVFVPMECFGDRHWSHERVEVLDCNPETSECRG